MKPLNGQGTTTSHRRYTADVVVEGRAESEILTLALKIRSASADDPVFGCLAVFEILLDFYVAERCSSYLSPYSKFVA